MRIALLAVAHVLAGAACALAGYFWINFHYGDGVFPWVLGLFICQISLAAAWGVLGGSSWLVRCIGVAAAFLWLTLIYTIMFRFETGLVWDSVTIFLEVVVLSAAGLGAGRLRFGPVRPAAAHVEAPGPRCNLRFAICSSRRWRSLWRLRGSSSPRLSSGGWTCSP